MIYDKFVCLITIKLNTRTDVPYQMTVGGAFVYVCKRGRVKDYITRFPLRGSQRPRYNGVAVYWEFLLLKIERVRQRIVLSRFTQTGFTRAT